MVKIERKKNSNTPRTLPVVVCSNPGRWLSNPRATQFATISNRTRRSTTSDVNNRRTQILRRPQKRAYGRSLLHNIGNRTHGRSLRSTSRHCPRHLTVRLMTCPESRASAEAMIQGGLDSVRGPLSWPRHALLAFHFTEITRLGPCTRAWVVEALFATRQ